MTKQTSAYHIDFEEWSRLAQTDPERFEWLRNRVLDLCITRASRTRQPRLRGLQWRINQIRDKSSNPLAACISISDMMWSTFSDLGDAYRDPDQLRRRPRANKATVLPFQPTGPEAE